MRVLIVEDKTGLAESMRRGLVGEGFVVDVVHDGVSGLWAASEFSYDAAILDIMLPGTNGYDVLKEIRKRQNWTPVIMLTAKDGEYDQTDAFDLGADDYLTNSSFLLKPPITIKIKLVATPMITVMKPASVASKKSC